MWRRRPKIGLTITNYNHVLEDPCPAVDGYKFAAQFSPDSRCWLAQIYISQTTIQYYLIICRLCYGSLVLQLNQVQDSGE